MDTTGSTTEPKSPIKQTAFVAIAIITIGLLVISSLGVWYWLNRNTNDKEMDDAYIEIESELSDLAIDSDFMDFEIDDSDIDDSSSSLAPDETIDKTYEEIENELNSDSTESDFNDFDL